MKANRWILPKLRSVCALPEVGTQELLGICVFGKILQSTFSILMSIPLTMIPKPDPCVKILFQIWIQTRSSMHRGDDQNGVSGQALEFKQLNIHAWEAFEKGNDVHMQAAPSQAELMYKNFKVNKEKLKSEVKETIVEKYENAAIVQMHYRMSSFWDKVKE